MMRTGWWTVGMLALLCTARIQAEDQKTGAAKTEDSGKPEPAKIGDEAQMLLRKVSLELDNTPLSEAMEFMKSLVKVNVAVSKGAAAKVVSLKLTHATLGEALHKIKEQAGVVHRLVDGQLQLATAEEWKEIDAGKEKFTVK